MGIQFNLSRKQYEAYRILTDNTVNELVFGGGARGGKSFLGSFFILTGATKTQPKSKWLIGRSELKQLKRTTLRTFFEVANKLGLKKGKHYEFNMQDMVCEFINGSVVFFAELKKIPSDPEFDRLGSYDLTGSWIDEAQQISRNAKDVLQFRFSQLSGNRWKTIPKTLYTCNPDKGWINRDFWTPLIKNKENIPHKRFITSLYTDNPWIDHEEYRKNILQTGNKPKIERLLYGNYEYDDNPYRLIEDDAIVDMFGMFLQPSNEKYISCDVARYGKDSVVIIVWDGLTARIYSYQKIGTDVTREKIESFMRMYNIPPSHVVIDDDGIGGGVVDNLKGCVRFINNSSPINPVEVEIEKDKKLNYANLKTQCYFKLAEYINARKISVICDEDQKELLSEDLSQIIETNIDNEKKITIATKEEIKQNIGRSPDYSDALMMRMIFELEQDYYFNPIFV